MPARWLDLKRAALEGCTVVREGHDKPLYLRRLILSHKTQRAAAVKGKISKRRSSAGATSASSLTPTVGAIFGSTLKSVLEFSGVAPSKGATVRALRHLVHFFAPPRDALASIRGDDAEHLLNGMGAHRVASMQRHMLAECAEHAGSRSYIGRNGYKDVAFGATAALLVAHYIMSVTGADAQGVAEGLRRCADDVDHQLRHWPISDSAQHAEWHAAALAAEERALSRARAAAVTAATFAEANQLSRADALRMQFEWMRAAAWPAGERCDVGAQAGAIARLIRGERVGDGAPVAEAPLSAMPPRALALSALPSIAWLDAGPSGCRSGAGETSSEDASSPSSRGTGSSSFSFSSLGSVADEDEMEERHAWGGTNEDRSDVSPDEVLSTARLLGMM